ncbi:lipopolysaccharide biosynthesis protein [Nocardia sp. NPDC088792]|uniref:lipopolysaccharide biosynthesis protein n=1 Tax=Nocardia sp. NPDC088792 TaxID=3364332 RepID=UPI00380A640A
MTGRPEAVRNALSGKGIGGILRDIGYVSFGKYGQYLVTVVTLPLAARVLGAAGLGLLAVGMSAYFVGTLLVDLGITAFLAARVHEADHDRAMINDLRASYAAIRIAILGGIGLLGVIGFSLNVPAHAGMILLGLFAGGFWSLSEDWLLIGRGRFGASIAYQSVGRAAYLLLLVVLLPRHPTAAMALGCLLGSSVLTVGLTWLDGFRTFGPLVAPHRIRSVLRTGAPVLASRLLTSSYGQGAAAVYSGILSATSLGVFSASDRLVRALQSLLDPIGFALLPRMARRGAEAGFWRRSMRALSAAVAAAAVVTSGTWLLAPVIIPLIFGGDFANAVSLLRVEVLVLPATTVTSYITTAVLPVQQDTAGVLIGAVLGAGVGAAAVLLALRSHSVWTLVGGVVAAEFSVAGWYLARMWQLSRRAARTREAVL